MNTLLDSDELQPQVPARYAGFIVRVFAYFIDAIILGIINTAIIFISFAVMGIDDFGNFMTSDSAGGVVGLQLISFLVSLVYFAGMESSNKQATLGKLALNLKVVDEKGQQLTQPRAAGRFLGKIVSSFILLIGFIMVAFHPKKQGLHDVMANTFVVFK